MKYLYFFFVLSFSSVGLTSPKLSDHEFCQVSILKKVIKKIADKEYYSYNNRVVIERSAQNIYNIGVILNGKTKTFHTHTDYGEQASEGDNGELYGNCKIREIIEGQWNNENALFPDKTQHCRCEFANGVVRLFRAKLDEFGKVSDRRDEGVFFKDNDKDTLYGKCVKRAKSFHSCNFTVKS